MLTIPRSAFIESPTPSVSTDVDANVLANIYQPEINIAVWQRTLATNLQSYARQLVSTELNWQTRFVERPALVASRLADTLPLLNNRDLFIDDVSLLVDMFSCLFSLEEVGIRLAILRKAMCPNFHVDRVPCRLVCTYWGDGTLWHPFEQVEYLGNSRVRPLPEAIPKQLATNDVALLKGEAWDGNEGRGLVHCSPPANDASPRLVLTLDFT